MKIVLGSDLSRPVTLGADAPLAFIAGPCVIESRNQVHEICGRVKEICADLGFGYVFKASFDKANRTSIDSFRGPAWKRVWTSWRHANGHGFRLRQMFIFRAVCAGVSGGGLDSDTRIFVSAD